MNQDVRVEITLSELNEVFSCNVEEAKLFFQSIDEKYRNVNLIVKIFYYYDMPPNEIFWQIYGNTPSCSCNIGLVDFCAKKLLQLRNQFDISLSKLSTQNIQNYNDIMKIKAKLFSWDSNEELDFKNFIRMYQDLTREIKDLIYDKNIKPASIYGSHDEHFNLIAEINGTVIEVEKTFNDFSLSEIKPQTFTSVCYCSLYTITVVFSKKFQKIMRTYFEATGTSDLDVLRSAVGISDELRREFESVISVSNLFLHEDKRIPNKEAFTNVVENAFIDLQKLISEKLKQKYTELLQRNLEIQIKQAEQEEDEEDDNVVYKPKTEAQNEDDYEHIETSIEIKQVDPNPKIDTNVQVQEREQDVKDNEPPPPPSLDQHPFYNISPKVTVKSIIKDCMLKNNFSTAAARIIELNDSANTQDSILLDILYCITEKMNSFNEKEYNRSMYANIIGFIVNTAIKKNLYTHVVLLRTVSNCLKLTERSSIVFIHELYANIICIGLIYSTFSVDVCGRFCFDPIKTKSFYRKFINTIIEALPKGHPITNQFIRKFGD